ncbi:MarR family winged helix-turn-helix transcriptional regulator [Neorhizobium alkalisoli]|uniref:MarR family transcriptional regulator n=1 Tax=Neorhizobium alkalisoli TaxID=528178 RepID=A0A561R6V4_9HYPH|nr:MarR family transcriptional regulator [Neorhizobium alkalisoli]TWF58349.1 MarR family transcriptional regulator [Neorhizobium alkalisoli]
MKHELKLDTFLCFALYTANHAMNRVYKPLLEALDITYPQFLVLVTLWEEDEQTVGSIGEKLFLESSTLTPILKRLEAAGYIRRERNRHDERQVIIRLTDQGRAQKAKAEAIPGHIVTATGCSSDEVQRLRQEISDLRDALNEKSHAA